MTESPSDRMYRLLMAGTTGAIPSAGPLRSSRGTTSLHVLDLTKYFGPTTGGIRTYLLEKACYVSRRPGLCHTLVVPAGSDGVAADGTSRVRCYRLASPAIPGYAQYRALLRARAIRRIIDLERPDVIEVGSPLLVPWITRWAVGGRRIPLVWFYHGNLVRLAAPRSLEGRHGIRHRLARRYVGAVGRMFDATLAASDFAIADLRDAGVSRIERVALGVDLQAFSPSRRESRDVTRRHAGWPEDRPVVLYLGRLAREKGLELAVRAWRRVDRPAILVLQGDGPDRGRLSRMAAGGEVLIAPHTVDRGRVADLIAAADVYLAPGPLETFGLSALEAMASGVPVLSVDSGAVPELIHRSGAGCTYRAGDAAGLAAGVERLLAAPDHAAIGARGRSWAEREAGWEGALDGLFDTYRRVIRS